jgi:hypothetical protein
MTDTMRIGPETPGRPTVRGIVVVRLKGEAPGFAWCEGPGKSISLVGATPADAARMRPVLGGLARWQVERREVEYWRSYTPPTTSLADRLRAAMAAMRGA